ncbi:MAG: DNA topoisomerase I, partial [Neisseriaceae bacterium]|nr:DNA topoisomerase I [Neisseriaceae bacterium]
MAKNLLIVESPNKIKSIKKYLGNDFEVLASFGHVRDLIPKNGAVDPENDFAMKYQIISKNSKHVDAIVAAAKQVEHIYLATDPDREGEAISWHIAEILKSKRGLKGVADKMQRVVFHEVTQKGIQAALKAPRDLDVHLVDAQQARRALDYLVGFNLSPLLWKKIRRGLSAGRVQSPALRLICERENEIRTFEQQEYWSIHLDSHKSRSKFSAKLWQWQGNKLEQFSLSNEAE